MAKVHRAYRHTWWLSRFQQQGMFGYQISSPVVEKEQVGISRGEALESFKQVLRQLQERERTYEIDWDAWAEKEYGIEYGKAIFA